MFFEKVMQNYLTLAGPNNQESVEQNVSEILDTDSCDAWRIHTIIKHATNAGVALETASSREGRWRQLYSNGTAGEYFADVECTKDAAPTNRLERYFRWKVTSTGTGWTICFTILATPQRGGVVSPGRDPRMLGGSLPPRMAREEGRLLSTPGGDARLGERWVALSGTSLSDSPTQDSGGWVDSKGCRTLIINPSFRLMNNANVKILTAASENGPWQEAVAALAGPVYLEPTGTGKLQRFVKWQVAPSVANWDVCFWLSYEFRW